MTKKQFIALAQAIKEHNQRYVNLPFQEEHLLTLARFCRDENPQFMTSRWRGYIEGTCGPCGGAVLQRGQREK